LNRVEFLQKEEINMIITVREYAVTEFKEAVLVHGYGHGQSPYKNRFIRPAPPRSRENLLC